MKKSLLALLFITGSVMAQDATTTTTTGSTTNGNFRLGVDFGVPYVFKADGNKVNERANYNIGLDGRYFINENLNVGARVAYDIEEQTGSTRQIVATPGIQYFWMPAETFVPYVRGDVPVVLNGASNTTGADDTRDVGISGGAGVAWNLGKSVGIQNMSLRYDFNLAYTFGISDAVPVLALEFARVGLDYRF